jgi:thiamine transport system ATP-binding protein
MLTLEALNFRHRDADGDQNYQFDLEVQAGEIVGLTGRSGSGKSTCLDLIAGFLSATAGRVLVKDCDINALPPGERPVTILFQNNNLFDHLSAQKNVALGINPTLRLSVAEQDQVSEALSKVGLKGMASRPAAQLSGGEQQRVALARSLVANKPVLLLDEPFSALDKETRDDMLSLVRQIVSERQLACLMVTHDARDCEQVADRQYRMTVDGGHRSLTEVMAKEGGS